MSDLNLENIVGFKAVDKDGNEQNVTVDEMVDMVSTRMVMALSETSTFAAAAATGNDVYENELPTVTDAANVRVLQSSGDAAKMTMQSLASKLGELLPLATNETKGLASMNMCIAYVGEGPVICIKPTKLKQYLYTLLTVTVYENGYFKKIDLAVYYPVKKGGHKCSMSGNGNMFVKEDSDYNLYIHNNTLNNINYCVSIIGASKYINIPSITVEEHPASVLNGLTLTDVATM